MVLHKYLKFSSKIWQIVAVRIIIKVSLLSPQLRPSIFHIALHLIKVFLAVIRCWTLPFVRALESNLLLLFYL